MNKEYIPSAVPFFLFGFVYYLITPFFALLFLREDSIVQAALNYIDLDFFNRYYFIDLFCICFFFLFGYFLFTNLSYNNKKKYLNVFSYFNLAPKFLFFVFLSFFFIFLINANRRGFVFLSGYSSYDIVVLGPFVTLTFMSVLFINFFNSTKVKKKFLILFVLTIIIVLSIGSRMFFVLGVISLSLGYISKNKRILRNLFFYIFLFVLLVFVLFIGLWRSSSKEINIIKLISIFIAEPLFTLTSASSYFNNAGGRPTFNLPNDVVASFINFIPTILYPNKVELLNQLTYNKFTESPFGASSLVVNLYSNFGLFYFIYCFLVGCYVGYIRKKAYFSNFFKAVYFTILPLFMFHFFREGFITVFKVLFFNSFILPFILFTFFYIIFNKKNQRD